MTYQGVYSIQVLERKKVWWTILFDTYRALAESIQQVILKRPGGVVHALFRDVLFHVIFSFFDVSMKFETTSAGAILRFISNEPK